MKREIICGAVRLHAGRPVVEVKLGEWSRAAVRSPHSSILKTKIFGTTHTQCFFCASQRAPFIGHFTRKTFWEGENDQWLIVETFQLSQRRARHRSFHMRLFLVHALASRRLWNATLLVTVPNPNHAYMNIDRCLMHGLLALLMKTECFSIRERSSWNPNMLFHPSVSFSLSAILKRSSVPLLQESRK